jgi:transposase
MRKIREILRLKHECGRSNREIGISCGVGNSTVSDYLQRAKTAGLNWSLPVELNDQAAVVDEEIDPNVEEILLYWE